ncbi:MAG: TAT-variant-translocated molybdopterin oxidoreductase [Planctomycetota bacterium]
MSLETPTPTTDLATGIEPLQGQRYWRSLHEYAQSPELVEKIAQEFPDYDPDELLGMSRRKFMKLAGASMALAGLTLTGCRRWPKEKVVAHNSRPEGTMPGVPETYASMFQRGGVATGVFVTSFDGRPIHVAGSPLHPICGDPARYDGGAGDLKYGSADVFTLASILGVYDPDRSRSVRHFTGPLDQRQADRVDWAEFQRAMGPALAEGQKIAVLSEANAGPAFLDTKKRFLKRYPDATWATWEPLHRDNEAEGAKRAFGKPLRAHYDTSKAMVLATFDSNFLTDHPASAKHARGWSKLRKTCDQGKMSRVYAVGSAMNVTSSNADMHLQVKPSTVAAMLDALAVELGVPGVTAAPTLTDPAEQAFVEMLAKDLLTHAGESIVVVGPSQPAGMHALAWSINQKLGNLGPDKTITLTETSDDPVLCVDAIASLTQQMAAGEVDTLLILGGNPVFDAPADLDFAAALENVGVSAHLSLYEDETSVRCDWHLPEAHYLECWGDGRAWDGTICLQQPIIEPLFTGKSAIETLALLSGDEAVSGYDLVRRAWSAAIKAGQYDVQASAWPGGPIDTSAERRWRAAVHDGLLAGSAYPAVSAVPGNASASGLSVSSNVGVFQVEFRSDPKVYDGRFANNGWLQELPEPITKVAWDNPAWVGVKDAGSLGLKTGDVIKITVDERELEVAVFVTPGQAEGVVVLTLGQGRQAGGRIGRGVGFDTYRLRGTDTQGVSYSAKVVKTGKSHPIATTSIHHLIDADRLKHDGTDWTAAGALDKRVGKKPGDEGIIVKQASLDRYKQDLKLPGQKSFANDDAHGDVSLQLYDAPLAKQFAQRAQELMERHPDAVADGWMPATQFNDKHAWAMTIDMTACIGCNACVIACQSENNIPVVGKDQVIMSREMQWMRIDSYYRGKPGATRNFKLDPDDGDVMDAVHMPVTCIHCENAPCEQVCPVAATVHDTEGLNTMVYNRCIGTRYCSNNCPYKVRRFNYFDYHSKLDSAQFRNSGKPGGIANNPWLKFPDQEPGDTIDQIRRMVFNPDVTVRMRGVMEKCTYCTQRINRAKISAKAQWAQDKTAGKPVDDYPYLQDGDVVTACQGACPTEAIAFGNLNDPSSKVSEHQNKNKRSYKLLEELNSRPRTQHMGLVRNPVKA